MNELIYDRWHFPRVELAASYPELLVKGTGDPIALQCLQAATDAGFGGDVSSIDARPAYAQSLRQRSRRANLR